MDILASHFIVLSFCEWNFFSDFSSLFASLCLNQFLSCLSVFFLSFATREGTMPSGLGASYRSLADDVYRSTTISERDKFSVLESVKKAFNFTSFSAQALTRRSEPLISRSESSQPVVSNR